MGGYVLDSHDFLSFSDFQNQPTKTKTHHPPSRQAVLPQRVHSMFGEAAEVGVPKIWRLTEKKTSLKLAHDGSMGRFSIFTDPWMVEFYGKCS